MQGGESALSSISNNAAIANHSLDWQLLELAAMASLTCSIRDSLGSLSDVKITTVSGHAVSCYETLI